MHMSLALIPVARMITRPWPRRLQAAAVIVVLMSSGAWAQTANEARVPTAHAEWRRLSQNEINCVDRALQAQRSGVWLLIQRGIAPSDASAAPLRAACRMQARAPKTSTVAHIGSQAAEAMAAAEKAAADKAGAEKAAADKAAADKTAADKAAPDKAAADKPAAVKAAADEAAPAKAVTDKPAADSAAVNSAKADAERAVAEAVKARADAERARKEAEKTIADIGFALAAAESRIGFIYGLISGAMGVLVLLGLAAVGFLVMRGKRIAGNPQSEGVTPARDGRDSQREFDRLVAAVLDEQKRRDGKAAKPSAPVRKQPAREPALV
jgi:hypothetical protein